MTSRRDEDRAIYDLLALAFEVDPDQTELEATDALADVLARASRLVAGFVHEQDAAAAPTWGALRGQQALPRVGALASHASDVRPDGPDMRGIRAGGWRAPATSEGAAPLEVANDTARAWDRPGSPIAASPTRHLKWALVAMLVVVVLLAPPVVAVLVDRQSKYHGAATEQTTAPSGEGFAPAGDPNASRTDALPGDVPVVATPGREVTVLGVPAPAVTVTVTAGGNPPAVAPATSFSTKGGSVVVVCDTYSPDVTRVAAKPGYYTNKIFVIFADLVFFTKPADGANPSITYRLTITCSSSGMPRVTVASYIGDQLMAPAPTST